MADYIYCGTQPPVDADGTQQLLRDFNAIWCPPFSMPVEPSQGDRVWLVWRATDDAIPVLLGGGRVAAVEGGVFWTERTLPGVRVAAEALNYPGPTNMRFLHLTIEEGFHGQPPVDLKDVSLGLSAASPEQVKTLEKVVNIP